MSANNKVLRPGSQAAMGLVLLGGPGIDSSGIRGLIAPFSYLYIMEQ